MHSVLDLRYSFRLFSEIRDLRTIYAREAYKEKLHGILFHSNIEDQEGLGELFIEYVIFNQFQARLSSNYSFIWDHMKNNNLGIKDPKVHQFFFTKFKESNPRRALQCIQIAKQYFQQLNRYCFSNFESIDSMSKELENLLSWNLEREYEKRHYTQEQIEEKLKSFEMKVYQSKNKRIKIYIDEEFRTLDSRLMIDEFERLQADNNPYTQLNPEEQEYDFKLIKPSFRPNPVIQSPNNSNDIAISEEINKLTPVSNSSTSNHLLGLFNAGFKPRMEEQLKFIVPIPTINQQCSPLRSLNRMKYRSIQKLRALVPTEKSDQSIPEPLKHDSPE